MANASSPSKKTAAAVYSAIVRRRGRATPPQRAGPGFLFRAATIVRGRLALELFDHDVDELWGFELAIAVGSLEPLHNRILFASLRLAGQ